MPICRRSILGLAAAGLAGVTKVWAQTPPPRTFEESFRAITPQTIADGDKIEVIDFFWYGCPYCYQLLPLMTAWEKSKPADVVLRRIPAVLRQEWLPDAHRYYTLDLLGEAERLHTKAFDAVHRDRILSADLESWARWAVAHGIDRAKWDAAHNAQGVRDKVVRAVETGRDYDVRATPVIAVDGRYQTGSGHAGSVENVVPTLEGLIKLARERRKKA
jgi:thiol:disulfide interchange protein DsbA